MRRTQRRAGEEGGDLGGLEADQGAILAALAQPQDRLVALVLIWGAVPQVGIGAGGEGRRLQPRAEEELDLAGRLGGVARVIRDRCFERMRAGGERRWLADGAA